MSTGTAQKKGKRGRKPSPLGPRATVMQIRGRMAWRVWIEEYAQSRRTTPAQLVDVALAMMSAADGFRPPPER